jgi:hypothetical protein
MIDKSSKNKPNLEHFLKKIWL